MFIPLTILYLFYIPSVNNKKISIYDDNFKHCELMRKQFDSISKVCIKVKLQWHGTTYY